MAPVWTDPETQSSEMEDGGLVQGVRNGEERCVEVLLTRYRNFARCKARKYFLAGADKQDVVQEGMIGLFQAVRGFDPGQGTPFRAFAELCISRQIQTAVKKANRLKHQPLNSSISLDAARFGDYQDDDRSIEARLVTAPSMDPVELVISAQEIEAIRHIVSDSLTELEGAVLRLYLEGKSYEGIARALGNHVKTIDNALQRIMRKLQRAHRGRNEDEVVPL